MQSITDFWKTTTDKIIILGGGGIIGVLSICFVCFIFSALTGRSENSQEVANTEVSPTFHQETVITEPTPSPVPTNTPEPTSAPTDTPEPTKYKIGQEVYLLPFMENIEEGRAIFKLPDSMLFSSVSDCNDLTSRKPEKAWIFHNQQGRVTNAMVCGGTTYYLVKVEDAGSIYEAWEDWLSESQLSDEPISPFGLPFYLELASDNESPDQTRAYIPEELVYSEGEESQTKFNSEPARLLLNSVQEKDINLNRVFVTSFTIFNDGTAPINFNTEEFFQSKNDSGYRYIRGGGVFQQASADVSVAPGQSGDFEIVWSTKDYRNTNGTLSDQIIYISVNASSISENLSVFVNENSVFFRVYLPEKER